MKPSIALAIILAALPARSQEFRRFADQQLELDVPRGWEPRWVNDRVFLISNRANAGGPGPLIEIKRYGERLDPEAMAGSVRKSLGGTFRRTERSDDYPSSSAPIRPHASRPDSIRTHNSDSPCSRSTGRV